MFVGVIKFYEAFLGLPSYPASSSNSSTDSDLFRLVFNSKCISKSANILSVR